MTVVNQSCWVLGILLVNRACALIPIHDGNARTTHREVDSLMSPRTARILSPFWAFALLTSMPNESQALVSNAAFDSARTEYFPGSLTNPVIALRIASTLRKRGYFPYNTVLGSCIGSDELNTTPSSLISILQNKMSSTDAGVYAMGSGAEGVPLTPEESFAEFVDHAPTDGKLLLIAGPNIGISKDGVVGKVERLGQTTLSNCGGAIAKTRGKSTEQIATATTDLYSSVWSKISAQLSNIATKQPEAWAKVNELTVIGGIMVNRGHGPGMSKGDDYFQPLTMRSYSGTSQTQLYDVVFSDLGTPRDYV